MNNICPKCGERLSPLYLKQTCPKCGVNLMYYKLDQRLDEDAANAAREISGFWLLVRRLDKAGLIEKYCIKKNKPFPWETSM